VAGVVVAYLILLGGTDDHRAEATILLGQP
jgi:hypothetical protein